MNSTTPSTATPSAATPSAATPSAEAILDVLTDWNQVKRRAIAPGASSAVVIAALRHLDRRSRLQVAERYLFNDGDDPEVYRVMAADRLRDVRAIAAQSLFTPVDAMARLVRDRSWYVRGFVASSSACPMEIYRQLIRDIHLEVRVEVAYRKLSAADLEIMASDPAPSVRGIVAQRLHLDEHLVRQLASDPSPYVRSKIAERAGPDDVLIALGSDPHPFVISRLADNPAAPLAALCAAAGSSDERARLRLVMHISRSIEVFSLLACDESARVRSGVARHCPHEPVLATMIGDPDIRVRISLMLNPDSSVAVLEGLPRPLNVKMKRALLHHDAVTADLAWPLLSDVDPWIRRLARRIVSRGSRRLSDDRRAQIEAFRKSRRGRGSASVSDPGLGFWLSDVGGDSPALWSVALDQAMPRRLRVQVLERETVPAEVLAAAARWPEREIRTVVAAHQSVSLSDAHHLVGDRSVVVRAALAENPNVAREVLVRLRRDRDPLVARTADRALRERARQARHLEARRRSMIKFLTAQGGNR